MDNRREFLEKAKALEPRIYTNTVRPVSGVPGAALHEGESAVLDFGDHCVGHLTLKLGNAGSHPDAPAWLELKFCESPRELDETLDGYHGWISKGWVQVERIHVDVLPAVLTLPRRYAFRYVRVTVLDTSPKFQLLLCGAQCRAESAADWKNVPPRKIGDRPIFGKEAVSLQEAMSELDIPFRTRTWHVPRILTLRRPVSTVVSE